MNNLQEWWKFYLFIAVACVVLFLLVGSSALILWVFVVYGVMAMWSRDQYAHEPRTRKPPVAEFFDADRR